MNAALARQEIAHHKESCIEHWERHDIETAEMKADLKAVIATLNERRGSLKALALLWGGAALVAGLVTKFLPMLSR